MSPTPTTPAAHPDAAQVSEQPEWLTLQEMCAALRIQRARLMKLVLSGEIRASRVGTGKNAPFRFHRDEPARYLASTRVEPVDL